MGRHRVVALFTGLVVAALLSTGVGANHDRSVENEHHHQHHPHHQHHGHHKHHNAATGDGDSATSHEEDSAFMTSHEQDSDEKLEDAIHKEYTSRRELFRLTDLNRDGLVTREEYLAQNGNISAVIDQVFMAYDGDGDGRFSEEEFMRQSAPLQIREECEEQIIQICDKLYLELRKAPDQHGDVDETSRCRSIQYLVDCVSSFVTAGCDITRYAHGVASKASGHLASGACPLLDVHELVELIEDWEVSQGEDGGSNRFTQSVDDIETTTVSDQEFYAKHCTDASIDRCSQLYIQGGRIHPQTADDSHCLALARYTHCMDEFNRLCPVYTENALYRSNMSRLRKMQSAAAKFCR